MAPPIPAAPVAAALETAAMVVAARMANLPAVERLDGSFMRGGIGMKGKRRFKKIQDFPNRRLFCLDIIEEIRMAFRFPDFCPFFFFPGMAGTIDFRDCRKKVRG
jgi:hypothetical protein